jgi:hypothetical protein
LKTTSQRACVRLVVHGGGQTRRLPFARGTALAAALAAATVTTLWLVANGAADSSNAYVNIRYGYPTNFMSLRVGQQTTIRFGTEVKDIAGDHGYLSAPWLTLTVRVSSAFKVLAATYRDPNGNVRPQVSGHTYSWRITNYPAGLRWFVFRVKAARATTGLTCAVARANIPGAPPADTDRAAACANKITG